MGFETLGGTRPTTVRPLYEKGSLAISFVNDSGAALSEGMQVCFKTDGTIDKVDAGSDVPIGVVSVGAANGERGTIETNFQCVLKATASGGTLSAGSLVKPTGTLNADGSPQYAVVSAGDWVSGICIQGNTVGLAVAVGLLRSPYKSQTA